jgi:hypothetical protein
MLSDSCRNVLMRPVTDGCRGWKSLMVQFHLPVAFSGQKESQNGRVAIGQKLVKANEWATWPSNWENKARIRTGTYSDKQNDAQENVDEMP